MKKIVISCFIIGLVFQTNSQTIELPETLISLNYDYLETKDSDNMPQRVKRLQDEVLNYKNVELSKLYDDEYETYKVSFYVPEGRIIAAYDKNGKIIRTIEKYDNVRLPLEVLQAISLRFPNWSIVNDVYFINYHSERDSLKHEYKIKLKNEDKIISIKTDEKGVFL